MIALKSPLRSPLCGCHLPGRVTLSLVLLVYSSYLSASSLQNSHNDCLNLKLAVSMSTFMSNVVSSIKNIVSRSCRQQIDKFEGAIVSFMNKDHGNCFERYCSHSENVMFDKKKIKLVKLMKDFELLTSCSDFRECQVDSWTKRKAMVSIEGEQSSKKMSSQIRKKYKQSKPKKFSTLRDELREDEAARACSHEPGEAESTAMTNSEPVDLETIHN